MKEIILIWIYKLTRISKTLFEDKADWIKQKESPIILFFKRVYSVPSRGGINNSDGIFAETELLPEKRHCTSSKCQLNLEYI